jgi:hypothetical protein
MSCDPAAVGDARIDVAAIALSQVGSSQPEVADSRCFGEGTYLSGSQPVILTRSGSVIVVTFTFEDGSRRAVGLHCAAGCSPVSPPTGPSG